MEKCGPRSQFGLRQIQRDLVPLGRKQSRGQIGSLLPPPGLYPLLLSDHLGQVPHYQRVRFDLPDRE